MFPATAQTAWWPAERQEGKQTPISNRNFFHSKCMHIPTSVQVYSILWIQITFSPIFSNIWPVRLLVSASPNQPANSVFLSQKTSTNQTKPAPAPAPANEQAHYRCIFETSLAGPRPLPMDACLVFNASAHLDIRPSTLYRKVRKYVISPMLL